MRATSRLACAVLALLACASGVGAQERPDTLRFRLDSLAIPVTRSALAPALAPVALSRVDAAEIRTARLTAGLDEALGSVPGLMVANRYNYSLGSRIVMRGLGARAAFGVRGVRILVDGIPLTMADGQSNLNNVELGSAGAIHVLRGPASALFGNAAGGVIAIETAPAPAQPAAEARIAVGDLGSGDAGAIRRMHVRVGQTVGRTDFVAAVARLDTDGFRDHSAAEQTQLNARLGYRAGPSTRLTVTVNAADAPVAQSPGSLPLDSARLRPTMAWPNNVRTGSGEAARQAQIGGRVLHARDDARVDASVFLLRRTLDNPLPFAYIELGRTAWGARTLAETSRGAWVLTGGFDVEVQIDDRREFANSAGKPTGAARRDQEDRVIGAAPFAQGRWTAGRLGLTAGGRYDVVAFRTDDRRDVVPDASGDRTLHAPSLLGGAVWLGDGWTAFGNIATSFQTPTTTELINAPPGADGPCCPAGFNSELEPERATSVEAGLRTRVAGIDVEAVTYAMRVTDALVSFQVEGAPGRDFFRNAGETRHRGVEASAAAALPYDLKLSAAATWQDVRFTDDGYAGRDHEDNRVPGIPDRLLYASLAWSPGATVLAADVRHTGPQYVDDANSARAPAYTLVDLRAQTRIRAEGFDVEPFAAVQNVFDRTYFGSVTVNAFGGRYYEPAPGRNFLLGAAVRLGGWRGADGVSDGRSAP